MLPVDPARYALFLGVMAVFAAAPGPANIFMIATGVRSGPGAVLRTMAGMNAASLVWIAGAALGLGALAVAFPFYFGLLAIAGGLYVGWLGVKSLWSAIVGGAAHIEATRAPTPGAAFRDGFAVQISNPKAIVFFSAVLPPFVDPARPALAQFVWLGATTVVMDVLAMTAYGLAGGALAAALQRRGPRRVFSAFVGVLLLGAAVLIMLRH